MNQIETYQKLIIEGIQELPPESLSEIMDFVYFIRKKTLQPALFTQEIQSIQQTLELTHLTEEVEEVISIKKLINANLEKINETELSKILIFINKLHNHSSKNTSQTWSQDYQTQVLGNWQGELTRPVNLPPESKLDW